MRHRVQYRKLGRTTPHRLALLRNLAVALIRHGRIQTTLPKAKELRRLADRLVTWGKRGTIDSRRRARRYVDDKMCLAKLFQELAPRFKERQGGYTRILKMNYRPGDQAPMALIEYVDNPLSVSKASPKVSKAKGEKTTQKTKAEKAPKAERPSKKKAT